MEPNEKRSIMDKKLKKLSRVELLELMVSLSEDYEALADENNRLKEMLAAQRLPRTAKVGSIAEAALEVNGYFEIVQHAADEYLREIKHLRNEFALQTDAEAATCSPALSEEALEQMRAEIERYLLEAKELANQTIAQANNQAEAIVAEAQLRADQAVANANRKTHAMVSQARLQAGPVISWQEPQAHKAPQQQQLPQLTQKAHVQRPPMRRGGFLAYGSKPYAMAGRSA